MEVCILIYNCFVILWSDSFEAEDATDVISMIFRSADWILASRYKVTKSHVSSAAVILASTHLSPASSLLSFYLRGFSTFSLYALVFVIARVRLNSFFLFLVRMFEF